MPKITQNILVEDFYKTTTAWAIAISWDISFTVGTPPVNKKGFIIIEPDSSSKRERMYYHDVIGSIIYVKWINRVSPTDHLAGATVQINDTSLIFNHISALWSTTFYCEKIASLGLIVWGWPIADGITTISVADTSIVVINNTTNYIYYKKSTNEIKTTTVEATANTDFGIIVAEVVTASGIITQVNYRNHKIAIGKTIQSITLNGTVWTTKTYRILYSDGTFFDLNVIDWRWISSIARTWGTGLAGSIDTYTITYNDASTSTYQVKNGDGISSTSLIWTVLNTKTYRITYTNGITFDYNVLDWKGISTIIKTGTAGLVDTYTITFNDTTTTTFIITNGQAGTSFIWKATYNAGTSYVVNDVVKYNGGSYICIANSIGNLPTNITYFDIMAEKWVQGDPWTAIAPTYTILNDSTDRALDVTSTTLNEVANVLATVIKDLTVNTAISGDGDKGDIIVSWGGSTWNVDATTVATLAGTQTIPGLKTFTNNILWLEAIFDFRNIGWANDRVFTFWRHSDTWFAKNRLLWQRSRGTQSSPTNIVDDDVLLNITADWYVAWAYTTLFGIESRYDVTNNSHTNFSWGFIGLDITNPTEKLDVNGNIKSNWTILWWLLAPEGFLINGKIVPSVTGNNLTVAIKTLAGVDATTATPIYVMIGGVMRIITTSKSITMNAGTNWFNAGSTELATKEIDYFVSLVWNTTSWPSVWVMISRIPYGTQVSDFSSTNTNEKYGSNGLPPTGTDVVVNIWRLAATLSAWAGYTWSIPTFTAGNLIQRPIYETRRLSYNPVYTWFSSAPSGVHFYSISGNKVDLFWRENTNWTSNATNFTKTTPFACVDLWSGSTYSITTLITDNGTDSATVWYVTLPTVAPWNLINCFTTIQGWAWTASNGKRVKNLQLNYQI